MTKREYLTLTPSEQDEYYHVMFTWRNKFYQCFKCESIKDIEDRLEAIGATYWEIGI